MRNFKIMIDSSCDMPKEYYQQHDVECVPLGFMMNDINYEGENGEAIDVKDFYQKLREGAMPTTYQITAEQAKEHIEPYLKKGQDVLALVFSSGLSGTCGSFQVAARDLAAEYPERKVVVIDTLCESMGEGMLLDYVIKKADAGASIEETAQYTEDLKLHICHHFTVDNLFHLHRGGRVSKTSAIVGTILKIKPILHMDDDGKLIVIGKTMGRKKSLMTIVDNFFASADMEENDPVYISHGDCIEDVEYVKNLILARRPNTEFMVHEIGAVIGTHSGPGTIAIFNKGKHR